MNAQISDLDTLVESPLDLALAEQTIALAKLKATWLAARDIFDPALNALVKAGIEPRFDATYCSVNFAGDKDKLLKVVRILVAAGFRMPTERPKAGDTSWYGHFSHPDTALSFFLNFTSSVCKRVKVGTKTVEQDVFETRCGDDLGAVEFAPAAAAPAIAEEILF